MIMIECLFRWFLLSWTGQFQHAIIQDSSSKKKQLFKLYGKRYVIYAINDDSFVVCYI